MRKLFTVLAVIWLAVLLRITVFRNGCFSHGLFSGEIERKAFAFYAELVRAGNWKYFLYLFIGNLIWFAPAGFLVRLWGGRFITALLIGFALSLFVEAGQFILGSGVSELDDLILNTLGACSGYGMGCLVFKRKYPVKRANNEFDAKVK
jgi:glycopeptide antibiotics resistance protein